MAMPYFPMYPADFEADTSHLTLEEDGAYNRLLRLMWMMPGCSLPDDDKWIQRRMRVGSDMYENVVLTIINEFFVRKGGRVFNPRLTEEFEKVDKTHRARVEAGKKGGRPKAIESKQEDAKAGLSQSKAGPKQPEPEPEPDPYKNDGGGIRAKEVSGEVMSDLTDREMILSAIGVNPISGMIGPSGKMIGTPSDMIHASNWMALPGMGLKQVCDVLREVMAKKRDGPPSSFKYFDGAMQRRSGELTMPQLEPIKPTGGRNGKLTDREQFDIAHAEYARRLSAGQIDRGPDPSDPWAQG